MDLIGILPALEAIARKINFQPLDDLIEQIKRFCEHMLKQLTPGEPIREGGQALNAYADRLNDLTTQLNAGLEHLQQSYSGPASAQYVTTTTATIQRARRLQTHINDAATYHSTLANHCIEAVFQQGMLIAQGAVMAVDLGSLIFTAGVDAPVSVPVAAGDAVVADGSAVAMDAAVDGAEATMSVIGDSATDLGEVAGDLGEEGSSALEDGGTVGETGATEGDPAPTEGGSGSGEEPPSEGGNGNGGKDGNGSDGNGNPNDKGVPDKAREVARYVDEHNGSPPNGYKGGRPFENDGRDGSQILDQQGADGNPITYREYDVNPKVRGVDRGGERIVKGSDGSWNYSPSHYKWFIPFLPDGE